MTKPQWSLPPLDKILDESPPNDRQQKDDEQRQVRLIEKTLADFDLAAQVRNIHHGPRLSLFSLKPDANVQISKIKRVEPDLAVALSGALAGIEEPTAAYPYLKLIVENFRQPAVTLRQVIAADAFWKKEGALKLGLGLNLFGLPAVIDLAALPHLLIGGATGSGKSVAINAMIAGLLGSYPPTAVQLLLIDPAAVELQKYNGLPHLFQPVITETGQVLVALEAVSEEVERRYQEFSRRNVRDIAAYNQAAAPTGRQPLPYLVVIIDNLLDLMMTAPRDLETTLTRLAARARAAGVHLILASLRTNVAAIAGSIKANFSGRIAFKTADRTDSQLILDVGGAETLLGQGDMYYKAPDAATLERIQGVLASEAELQRLVDFWTSQ